MFIDVAELKRRRDESNNLVERLNVASPVPASSIPLDTSKFKQDGTHREVPAFDSNTRALIGVSAIAVGPEKTSEIFGVSKSYAQVLGNGNYSSAKDDEERERRNQELKDAIYDGLANIREAAREKLMLALSSLDEEAIEHIKPTDRAKVLAGIANQLSAVIDRTINKGEGLRDAGKSTHLHLYAPETRPLAAFTIKRINSPVEDSGNAISE
jgi:hypothetical protein